MALKLNALGRATLASYIDQVAPTLSVDDVAILVESEPLFQEAARGPVSVPLIGLVENATLSFTVTPNMVNVLDLAARSAEVLRVHSDEALGVASTVWQAFYAGSCVGYGRGELDGSGSEMAAVRRQFHALYPGHHARLVQAGVFQ